MSWEAKDFTALAGGVFGAVGSIVGGKEQRRASQAQADALIKQGLSQVEVARIMQQTELLKLEALKAQKPASGNKALYIGLAVGGVVILGGIIFAVTRR
jgi:hypothetical protein